MIHAIYVVATHNGFFHADEVIALAVLSRIHELHYGHNSHRWQVIRTRDTKILETADCLVDVGGVYDPANNKLDHHMSVGVPTYGEVYSLADDHRVSQIKLASAGMMWLTIGHMYPGMTPEIHAAIGIHIFAPIDAVDNGQLALVGDTAQLTLSQLISGFNIPANGMDVESWESAQAVAFQKAMEWVSAILFQLIDTQIASSALRHRALEAFEQAINEETDILHLKESLPWKEAMLETWDRNQDIKLVIMPHPSGAWYIQTLTAEKDAPQSQRCSAPKQIRGLRDQELNSATECTGCIFIHPSGFLGAADTLEEASWLARWWIDHSAN